VLNRAHKGWNGTLREGALGLSGGISVRWPQAVPLVATSLAFALVQLDVTIVTIALDRLRVVMSGDAAWLQWVVDGYTLSFAGLLLTGGALGDRFGARRIYLLGLSVFTLASLGCGIAPSAGALIIARVIQGVGAALLLPCSLALLVHMYRDPHKQAQAIAVWGSAGGLAMVAGPVVGGVLISLFGWRSVFLVNIPLGIAAVAVTIHAVPDTNRGATPRSFDLAGQVLAIVLSVALTGSIIEGPRLGWMSPLTIGGVTTFLVASVGFLAAEGRNPAPMMPLYLFQRPSFSAASAIGIVLSFGFYGMIFLYSLYFQRYLGMSPLEAGFAFVPMTGFMAASNIIAGYAVVQWGPRLPIVVGLLVGSAGYGLLAIFLSTATTYREIWWMLLLVGFSAALTVTAMTAAAMRMVEPIEAGIASGVLNAVRQTAGAIGVAVLGVIGVAGTSTAGMRLAAVLVCVLYALASVVGLLFIAGGRPLPPCGGTVV